MIGIISTFLVLSLSLPAIHSMPVGLGVPGNSGSAHGSIVETGSHTAIFLPDNATLDSNSILSTPDANCPPACIRTVSPPNTAPVAPIAQPAESSPTPRGEETPAPQEPDRVPDASHDPQVAPRPAYPFNAFVPVTALPPPPPPKVQWASLFGASARYLTLMHSFRIMTEPGTRDGLKHNPFWGGYLAALGAMHGWSDGDGYYENYLGHPIQGAVSGYIWLHNDPRYRHVQFGKDPAYWKSRLRAYAFAWAFSEQFEVGLISEASIGQIQRYCCQFGFVDHVITPNGGMVWMVGEDAVDRYIVRRIEDHTSNKAIRISARVALNPLLSFANLMNLEYPWHRENRESPTEYVAGSFVPARPERSSATEYPLVPTFEITATVPSLMNIGGHSCLGGGAVGGFRISDNWQWTAEVGGCTLGNSLPKDWSGDSLTFTTGPQWILHSESRWTPHLHLRFGGQKITEQYMDQRERQLIEKLVPPGQQLNPYYDLFTTSYESTGPSLSVGGGIDYRLTAALAVRVAGIDYVHSWMDPVHGTNFNSGTRFTTGLVLRVGTW
jgi:hypothetical protein